MSFEKFYTDMPEGDHCRIAYERGVFDTKHNRSIFPNDDDEALIEVVMRAKKLKGNVSFLFAENGKFGWKTHLVDLTFNDYGRLCEIGYIISTWKLPYKRVREALEAAGVENQIFEVKDDTE